MMQMGNDEIRIRYKYAKDKKKMIPILSDLNLCSKDIIKEIVGENPKSSNPANVSLNAEQIDSLFARLDELEEMIKPLESEYKRTVQMILSAE